MDVPRGTAIFSCLEVAGDSSGPPDVVGHSGQKPGTGIGATAGEEPRENRHWAPVSGVAVPLACLALVAYMLVSLAWRWNAGRLVLAGRGRRLRPRPALVAHLTVPSRVPVSYRAATSTRLSLFDW